MTISMSYLEEADAHEGFLGERASRDILRQALEAGRALEEIANGDGAYGGQAFEYKNIARKALGEDTI